ncbi:hypothetical protein EHS39_35920 [Ensifer sp. MPMI2T]|nr:hypothetical protein EHS39_35920 [Ensifer sp. MPMI2T]
MVRRFSPARGSACEPGDRDRHPAARSISSSIFIGSGTLAIRCAELAMEMGHDIRAVLSADAIFADWAARANISVVANIEELSTLLAIAPVEWNFFRR